MTFSGCKPLVKYDKHPCPERPQLPRVTAKELAPLSKETYLKLVERQAKRRTYIERLEVHCKR